MFITDHYGHISTEFTTFVREEGILMLVNLLANLATKPHKMDTVYIELVVKVHTHLTTVQNRDLTRQLHGLSRLDMGVLDVVSLTFGILWESLKSH